jgi:hypothetical protein
MRSRVVCGTGDTIASGSPSAAFSNVDFPTLGRPTMATVPLLCGEFSGVARFFFKGFSRSAGARRSCYQIGRSKSRARPESGPCGNVPSTQNPLHSEVMAHSERLAISSPGAGLEP